MPLWWLLPAIPAVALAALLVPMNPSLGWLSAGVASVAFIGWTLWRHRHRWWIRVPIALAGVGVLALVLSVGTLLLFSARSPGVPAGPVKVPFQLQLTLRGDPEVWEVAEVFALPAGPGAPDPSDPALTGLIQRQVGDEIEFWSMGEVDPRPDPSGRRTLLFDWHLGRAVGDQLYLPSDGSKIFIQAPAGAVLTTYPQAEEPVAIPGTGTEEHVIVLDVGRLDQAPPRVIIETTPTWGRDRNLRFLWTLSASSLIAVLLAALSAIAGALFADAVKAIIKRTWTRLRRRTAPPRPGPEGVIPARDGAPPPP